MFFALAYLFLAFVLVFSFSNENKLSKDLEKQKKETEIWEEKFNESQKEKVQILMSKDEKCEN